MEQEKKDKKGMPSWIWVVIVGAVIIVAAVIWLFAGRSDDSASTTEGQAVSSAPKHADWQTYKSPKYGFTLSYPIEYTLAEGNTGTVKLSKDSVEIMDLYITSAAGDSGGMMKSQEALFTDDTKGYMTGGAAASTTAGSQTATIVSGTFGKNAGISQTHTGIKGSAVFFINDDKQYVFDSYDNGDSAAQTIFQDIIADIKF